MTRYQEHLKAFILAGLLIFSTAFPANALTRDELKVGVSQEFENLNPLIMSMVATVYIYAMTGRPLSVIDHSGKWVPMLAEKLPSLEDGTARLTPDKKHVVATWVIKEKARWSDGKPVTCEDVQFARDVATSPNVSVAEKETYAQVMKVEWDKAKPKVCTFTYNKPKWDFHQLGTFYVIPKHIEEPIFKKYGAQKEGYEKNSNFVRNPTMDGLYSGPYKIAEVKLGSHVTFVPNPYFYGEPPKFKKIIVKLIPNTGTLEANIRSGTIDMISVLGLTFDQALQLEKKAKSEKLPFHVVFKNSIMYEHIDLNLDNPILKDLKVRRALVHGINREELVKALFEGKQQAALHFISPIDPWFVKDPKKIKIYNYSRREANRLLDEAGWKKNPKDGYRYKDGKKLVLPISTTAGNKTRETVQTFLQNQWKEIGVEVPIKNEPARVFFGETTRKRKYPAMAMYAWSSSPENNPQSTLHSSSIPNQKNGWSGQNHPGWVNKKVDEAIEKIEVEFDKKKRLELITEIAKAYTEEVPVIPLYYRADVAVPPTQLQNFALTGHQFYDTYWVENWNVK